MSSSNKPPSKNKSMKKRRNRNAPIIRLMMNARKMTRSQLKRGSVGFGLYGMFKGNTMKKGAMRKTRKNRV